MASRRAGAIQTAPAANRRSTAGASTTARGRDAESRARRFLENSGFRILATNFRTAAGEIDIVAQENDVVCFVEVRSLSDGASYDPLETITYEKRRRIERAAEVYLQAMPGPLPVVRFDVVSVQGPRVELLRDAFQTG